MEDAGFILGSYVVTFGGVGRLRRGTSLRRGRRLADAAARRRQALDLIDPMTDLDLTPAAGTGRPPRRRRRRRWLPLVVLGAGLVAGGVIVTQFLTLGRRLLLQRRRDRHQRRLRGRPPAARPGHGRRGHRSATVDGVTTFTISFNGVTLPVRYDGEPGGIFKECIPVVVHGESIERRHVPRRPGRGQALQRVRRGQRRTRRRRRSRRLRRRYRRRHARRQRERRARPGRAAARAGRPASFGASTVLYGIRRGDDRGCCATAPRYAWLCARRRRARRSSMMERALITRDFSLAYVQQVGSRRHAAAVQLRRDVVGARGLDPAVGADPRRLHGGRRAGGSASAPTTRSSAGRWS